jgi:hypothetical protein
LRLVPGLGVAFGLGALAAACTSDLELGAEGKRCSGPDRLCLAGYECNSQDICVRKGQAAVDDGGLGGGGVDPGGRGGAGGEGAAGGEGSLGGRGGRGGGGSSSGGLGGAGGSNAAGTPNVPDGGSGTLPDGGCIPANVYHDVDGDGFGTDSESMFACPSLEWVPVGGDCRDDLLDVNPGQQSHFAVGYASSGPGGVSFDYDCANGEQPDPNNDTNAPAPDCAALLGLGCTGSGFENASPARSGPGIEPRCGSNVLRDCVGDGLTTCDPRQTPVANSVAFRCR